MRILIDNPRAGYLFIAATAAGLAIFAFAVTSLLLPHAAALGDRQAEMTCLQIAFTSERAMALIGSFDAAAQRAMAQLLVPGDMVFAWGYGLTLAGLTGLLALQLDGGWRRFGAVAIWFPLAAALLDDVEDVFLFLAVRSVLDNPDIVISPLLPAAAGMAALAKYLALMVLTPGYAVAGIGRGLAVNRRPVALLVYALLAMMIYSLFARLVPQLPQCFG